jgi:hypothetical protein
MHGNSEDGIETLHLERKPWSMGRWMETLRMERKPCKNLINGTWKKTLQMERNPDQ